MYIRGLIPQNNAEFAEAVPIENNTCKSGWSIIDIKGSHIIISKTIVFFPWRPISF